MKRHRTYFAWLLLLAAMTIAVPRTWIHRCNTSFEKHNTHREEGGSDEFRHGACQFCDFAAATALEPNAPIVFWMPIWETPTQSLAGKSYLPTYVVCTNLRGPPTA